MTERNPGFRNVRIVMGAPIPRSTVPGEQRYMSPAGMHVEGMERQPVPPHRSTGRPEVDGYRPHTIGEHKYWVRKKGR